MTITTNYPNLKRFSIKLFSWEYWPMWIVYLPSMFYYIFLAIKSRSFFFFSASNPSIETGGMFFESKWKIYKLIPQEYYPATIFIEPDDTLEIVKQKMNLSQITYPLIAKPDRGGRGWGVKLIREEKELAAYISNANITFLIQSYIDYPLEFSVFYHRYPNSETGEITSVTFKKPLTVVGDGISTIHELINKQDRAFLQTDAIKKNERIDLNSILKLNEEKVIVPYGNHVRGALFQDFNHIIDAQLTKTFDKISKQIDGFYFGRYDLKCTSLEDLKQGKNISIIELNGAGAEPAHIYDPGFSFFNAQRVLFDYYKRMYTISNFNHKQGTPFMNLDEFKDLRKQEREYRLKLKLA